MDGISEAANNAESRALTLLPPARLLPPAPLAPTPKRSVPWFDAAVETAAPKMDGTLGAEREAALAYQRMVPGANSPATASSAAR